MEFNATPLCVFIIIIIITSTILRLTEYGAFPHMTTNDDEYDGYYIPKGTIVFGNSWLV